MSAGAIVNVSNPAAYGAEWRGEAGTIFQLVNAVGSSELRLGVKPADSPRWISVRVDSPERFGFHGPCKTSRELMDVAYAFVRQDIR